MHFTLLLFNTRGPNQSYRILLDNHKILLKASHHIGNHSVKALSYLKQPTDNTPKNHLIGIRITEAYYRGTLAGEALLRGMGMGMGIIPRRSWSCIFANGADHFPFQLTGLNIITHLFG